MNEEYKPRISNTEWGLVIGVLLVIDLVQIVLDLFAIGVVLNTFIDVFVGMAFALYLQMHGQSLAKPKRLFAFIAALGFEFIPAVNALPLWVLDGLYNRHLAKKEDKEMRKRLSNIPIPTIIK